MPQKIIFIYNAKAGIINGLFDTVHKIISPTTYPCELCALTYGLTGMHLEWKQFLESLPLEIEFLYTNTLHKKYPKLDLELPAILFYNNIQFDIIVSSNDLQQLNNLAALIQLMQQKLSLIIPTLPLKS